MAFKLSQSSLQRLEGVNPSLRDAVQVAIYLTKVDFGVTCGVRTVEEQKALVESGASQTMQSKHIDGLAVDLVAYIGPRVSWELNLYDDIAEAMAQAARDLRIAIRWGGCWHIDNIAKWGGTMEKAMNAYVDLRRSQGKRPFIDGPHFELVL